MLQLPEYVRTQRFLVKVVFNNFLLIDTTDRSKISSNQKRFFHIKPIAPFIFREHSLQKKENNNIVTYYNYH